VQFATNVAVPIKPSAHQGLYEVWLPHSKFFSVRIEGAASSLSPVALAEGGVPEDLAGRLFVVIVHGDTVGAETLRRSLFDRERYASSLGRRENDAVQNPMHMSVITSLRHEPKRSTATTIFRRSAQCHPPLMEAADGKRKGLLVEGGTRLREPRPK
jgi:hypothetical protein